MSDFYPILAQYNPEVTDAQIGFYILLGIVILLLVSLFFVLPMFFIYKKAGKPAWAAIVPFYNLYVYGQITGRNPLLIALFPFALGLLSLVPIVNFATTFLGFAYSAILAYDLAIVFGQSQGLGIANIFFQSIINFYLAFSGNAQYQGPLFGADKRIMLESPWIDPALGVQAVNPYAAHTYAANGHFDPNMAQTYQPPAYNPQAAPGTPGAPVVSQPGQPGMPAPAGVPGAPDAPGVGGQPVDAPGQWAPADAPAAPPAAPPSAPSESTVATQAADWGPAPEAFDTPYTPGQSQEGPAEGGQTENPFDAK